MPDLICYRGKLYAAPVDLASPPDITEAKGACDECSGIGCTLPNEAEGEYRAWPEYNAGAGESLLQRSSTWEPPNDTDRMSVPEMIVHIYKNRKGHAVAPNGHTTPFVSVEEWTRIVRWADPSFSITREIVGDALAKSRTAVRGAVRCRQPR